MKKQIVEKKGITLIALVITIIVLLILAGVTIATLTGDNGILKQADKAKEQTIIGQEKEEIGLAYVALVGDNTTEGIKITAKRFEDEINKNRGANDVSVDSDLGNYIVYYANTNHTYSIDKYRNVTLIVNIEPTETIYVVLKGDTLTFSNNLSGLGTIDGTPYTISKGALFENESDIPWKNIRSSIIYVDFVNKIVPINTQRWFNGCQNLIELKNMRNLDTSQTISMRGMFDNCAKLTTIDLSHFSTKNVTNLRATFANCSKLTSLDLSLFNTSKVIYMQYMFTQCSKLTSLNLNNFDTSNVEDMEQMFNYCSSLTSLNLNSFNTGKVTNMKQMFYFCTSLTELDLSNFDTRNVTNMWGMFGVPNNPSSQLKTITFGDQWDMSKITNMSSMFDNCVNLETIYATRDFTTNGNPSSTNMFKNCSKLTGERGTKYNSSNTDKTYARIDGGPTSSTPGYFTYKASNS